MAHGSLASYSIILCRIWNKNIYSTPQYPQSNSIAEIMNKTLLDYLKKMLTSAKGKWVDKLPIVLWAYCTASKLPTGKTPYALAFGAEDLIPIESDLETLRTYDTSKLSQALDELEEKRDRTTIRMTKYHHLAFSKGRKSSSLELSIRVILSFDVLSRREN